MKAIGSGIYAREEEEERETIGSATSARSLGILQEIAKERVMLVQELVEENRDGEVELVSKEAFAVDFMRNKIKELCREVRYFGRDQVKS